VTRISSCNLSRQDFGGGLVESSKFREQILEPSNLIAPLPLTGRSGVSRPAFRSMLWICRSLTPNALQLIAHPKVHVAQELPDGMREILDAPPGKFDRNILNTSQWIGMRTLAVQKLDQRLFRQVFPLRPPLP